MFSRAGRFGGGAAVVPFGQNRAQEKSGQTMMAKNGHFSNLLFLLYSSSK